MATSATTFCSICEARLLTKYAEFWCPECAEGLCSKCLQHHSLSKATRRHELISIENYEKLPTVIAGITNICKEHETKFSHYCQQHDQKICMTTDHKMCVDLPVLTDVIRNSKTSALMSVLEEELSQMLTFIEQGILSRQKNLTTLKEDHQIIVQKIKQMQIELNSHLDKLEETILEELTGNHSQISLDIQAIVRQLLENSNKIKELKESLTAVKKYGSDLQTFFFTRMIDDHVTKHAENLKSTSENKSFSLIKIHGKIDGSLIEIFGLTSFGEINVVVCPSSLECKVREEKTAQTMSEITQRTPKSVHDIKLKLLSTFKISRGKCDNLFRGCTVKKDGEMIFADNGNCCLVLRNPDNPHYKEILLPTANKVYDVTLIDQHTVAVSTDIGINIIDIDSKKSKDVIKTDRTCYGISYYKGSLIWCEKNHGIKEMELEDRVVSTILQRKLPRHSFLKAYNNKIYLTDPKYKTVECCSLDGGREWTFNISDMFKDITIYKKAINITIDNNMFVYISLNDLNNVVVISPDGAQGRQLLSSKDRLNFPKGIGFDRRRNHLFLVNNNGTVFIYHVD